MQARERGKALEEKTTREVGEEREKEEREKEKGQQ